MIDIINLIIDGAYEFECKIGEKPTSIYLGRLEYKRLKEWAYKNAVNTNVSPLANPIIHGMTVYGVNEATHIGYSLWSTS